MCKEIAQQLGKQQFDAHKTSPRRHSRLFGIQTDDDKQEKQIAVIFSIFFSGCSFNGKPFVNSR